MASTIEDMDVVFFQFVDKTSSSRGCWLWKGFIHPGGYVQFWFQGVPVKGHRYSYELFEGPIPDGHDVHHICGVKHCVNPSHLETLPKDIHRALHMKETEPWKWQSGKTHCPQGHEYTKENTYLRYNKRYCLTCRNIRNRETSRKRSLKRKGVLD